MLINSYICKLITSSTLYRSVMTTLYMIHGFIGVGKTTFSKKLETKNNIIRFTSDEWMVKLFGHNPEVKHFSELEGKVKSLIWDIARKILLIGCDVILDYGFWTKSERNYYKHLAAEMGVNIKLYNLLCPEEIIEKRVIARNANLQDSDLYTDKNALVLLKRQYQPIEPDEENIIINVL